MQVHVMRHHSIVNDFFFFLTQTCVLIILFDLSASGQICLMWEFVSLLLMKHIAYQSGGMTSGY